MRMHSLRIAIVCCAALAWSTKVALGHGTPIDVSVVDGKLTTDASVYAETFNLLGGVLITTSLPGIGVSTTSNGLSAGDDLGLDVVHKLLYWNGSEIAPATASLTIENHDGDQSYVVTDATGLQEGLYWGTYSGSTGWHRHGDYFLNPLSAPAGAYGVVVQLTSPDHEASDPFLIAFNWGLSSGAFQEGIAAFQTVLVPEPSTFALLAVGGLALLGAARSSRRRR